MYYSTFSAYDGAPAKSEEERKVERAEKQKDKVSFSYGM